MPGLLDITDDPNTLGLLSLGLRLMSTPGKFGTTLGQAGMGALGDLQQARQMVEQRKLREQQAKMQGLQMQSLEQQLADAQRAREEAAALRQTRNSFLDSIDPNAGPAMPPTLVGAMRAGFSPQEAQTFLPPKVESQFAKVDPKDYTPESVAIFSRTGNFADLKPRTKVEFVDGQAVDPFSTPVGTVIPQRAPVSNAATDLLIPGPDGRLVPNQVLIDAKKQLVPQGTTVKVGGPDVFKAETDLRKEFGDIPQVKRFNAAIPAFKAIEDAASRNTMQSDINLIYGIAKLYDPESVVREGEYDTIANSQSIPERVKGLAQQLAGGGRLTPETKAQLLIEARGRIGAFKQEYDAARSTYEGIATRRGLDPQNIFISSPQMPVDVVQKAREEIARRQQRPRGGQ